MLCKSCGKNISSSSEKCPHCGNPSGFLVGLNGQDDPESVAQFSVVNDNGSFRNSERMRYLNDENESLRDEVDSVRRKHNIWIVIALVEAILLVAALAGLAISLMMPANAPADGSSHNTPGVNDPSVQIGSNASLPTVNSSALVGSSDINSSEQTLPNTSEVTSSEQAPVESETPLDQKGQGYKKTWDALTDRQLESVTRQQNGTGTNTRVIEIKQKNPDSANSVSYSVTFYTNATKAATCKATVDTATGVLKGITEKGDEFTITITTKKGKTVYVVDGTNFYYGSYSLKAAE